MELEYWSTLRKTSRNKGESQQQTQPHMTTTSGFEPGPLWWEAIALTIAPSIASKMQNEENKRMALFR